MKKPKRKNRTRLSRREFIRYTAGAGLLLGMGNLLTACGDDNGESNSTATTTQTETRRFLFNLSHIDFSEHDVILVAGKQRQKLEHTTPEVLEAVRQDHPILQEVPDEHITHHLPAIEMPADAIQLCYLQRVSRTATDGQWDLVMFFYHLPTAALRQAQERRMVTKTEDFPPVPVKWAKYGITADQRTALADPIGEEVLKDSTDNAVALVFHYPELISGEPNSAAHIQTNIIATQPTTQVLSAALERQGPATPSGGWATQTPLIDPDTGQPFLNSQGQIQYMPVWSQETEEFVGQAILPSLSVAKNDPTLGVNITDIDPATIQNNDPDAPTNGAVWTLHDGLPTVEQSADASLQATSGFSYTVKNQSPEHGYSIEVQKVDTNSGFPNITIKAKNWYVRHLGLFIRYLDANGQPIAVDNIASKVENSFPLWSLGVNTDFDIFTQIINPEWVVLGIPVEQTTIEFTFPLPEEATSVMILASGLGSGSKDFSDTLTPGIVMTAVIDLGLPTLFIALGAAQGFVGFVSSLKNVSTALDVLNILLKLVGPLAGGLAYDDPPALKNFAVIIGQILLSKGAGKLASLIAAAIAAGESEAAVEDAVPVVGAIIQALVAAALISQVVQTIAEVANSPWTYVGEVTFTHNVKVTISHDPKDPAGFPAVADHFVVTAIFDQGTPYSITQQLPGTTVTAPITVTFTDVPFGGKVTVNVGFYSNNGWLAGQGSVGPVDNVSSDGPLSLAITITENLVPLTADTTYSPKEIIVLDDTGKHQWKASTTPPTVVNPAGQCEDVDGQICSWTGITISTMHAAVGYSWQAYNQAVTGCTSGAVTQLYQFANISITQDPESAYFFSGCGFSAPARVVYDLMGTQDQNFYLDTSGGKNLIRQIRLSGTTPSFDGPNSNRAWGRLNFNSDALLLHPIGKIISVNSELNKIEVLKLPKEAVPDDEAPLAQAYSGRGLREGLVDGPTLAVLTPKGTILVLETRNNRIQAFDLSANPVPHFHKGAYHIPLKDQPVAYLDMAVEYTGYIYVLSYTGEPGSLLYRLDIYTPEGDWLARTTGVNADKLAVNYWRDLFTLNYEVLTLPDGTLPDVTEPSVSHWIPSTP